MTKDLVEILNDYCNENGMAYSYGRKANLNLLKTQTVIEADKVYLLHEPFPRDPIMNDTGTRAIGTTFSGGFFLVVNSTPDMPYFNEGNSANADDGKYRTNIAPLFALKDKIMNFLLCAGFDVSRFSAIDVVNLFDENRDGILVTYQVKQYD